MSAPVLVVFHQENSSAGRVVRHLRQMGHELDCRCPRMGDTLPKTMKDHSGAVIFGGPMSANDSDEFIRREIDWIDVPLREEKPFLGICLGAQMLAKNLGEKVQPHDSRAVECGYYPIFPTQDALGLSAACGVDLPEHVYHWHGEGFDVPKSATLLARGEQFPNQAFSYGKNAFGLQFHPEVTYAMMCRWAVRGGDRANAPGAKPLQQHLSDWFMYDGAVAKWSRSFLKHWLKAG